MGGKHSAGFPELLLSCTAAQQAAKRTRHQLRSFGASSASRARPAGCTLVLVLGAPPAVSQMLHHGCA